MDFLYQLKRSLDTSAVAAGGETDRQQFLASAKAFVLEKKAEMERLHLKGAGGITIVAQYTALADDLIKFIYSAWLGEHAHPNSALVALGGYGRKELCFCSDIDIMLLHQGPLQRDIEELNSFLISFLWDIGFRVGHSVRSVGQAARMADTDDISLNSMLEGRLLIGDPAVLDNLRRRLFALLQAQGIKKFIQLKKRERAVECRQAGDDIYQGEPDLKLTAGGLRDYHAGMWIALARFGLRSLNECHKEGLLDEEQFLRLEKALDFMWRVRNQMHLQTAAPHDLLTLNKQEQVTVAFGYRPARGSLPVELFMQDYYIHAAALNGFYKDMLRSAGFLRKQPIEAVFRGGKVERGLRIVRRRVFPPAGDKNWFRRDPARLLELFWYCQKQGYMLSENALESIRRNLGLVDEQFRNSQVAKEYFFAILADPERVGSTMRLMSGVGLLDRYLPEFGSIRNLVRYHSFHQYPVHEHTLRALENLALIPQLKEMGADVLKQILPEIKDPALLSLAILLHDLGKSGEGDHVENGAEIADTIAERLEMNEERRRALQFLIRNHLRMTHLSQYRDIDDLEIIRSFASEVETLEKMNMLYLLTFADLHAVRQGSWNDWKSSLLHHLYQRTKEILGQAALPAAAARPDESPKISAANEYLGSDSPMVQNHLRLLPQRYLQTFHPKEIADHIRMIATLKRRKSALKCVSVPQYSLSHVTVCASDRLGLFAEIVGAFASQQVSVLSASIFTRSDGIAIDSFYVIDAKSEGPLASARWALVKERLRKVIRGERDVRHFLQHVAESPRALQKVMTTLRRRVHFDNQVSATHTVIDIEAPDRVGLLYDIASAFSRLGLNISVAKVTTDVRQARDAFYVTDTAQNKITDPLRLEEIKVKIEEALDWRNPANASRSELTKDKRRMKA